MRARTLAIGAAIATYSGLSLARDPPHTDTYAELRGGPAFANYLPADGGGGIPEHLVTSARQFQIGGGRGWELGAVRLDAGIRLLFLELHVAGRYSADERDDAFRASYSYLAPALTANVTTRFASRLNGFAGLSFGTAVFVSDKQGQPLRVRAGALFGMLEGGFALTIADWLEARAGIGWVPPVRDLNVVMPTLGVRIRI
jgi:hypothetical protein